MTKIKLYKNIILIGLSILGLNAYFQTIDPWDMTELKQAPNWKTNLLII